jgi:hypothetical protein
MQVTCVSRTFRRNIQACQPSRSFGPINSRDVPIVNGNSAAPVMAKDRSTFRAAFGLLSARRAQRWTFWQPQQKKNAAGLHFRRLGGWS